MLLNRISTRASVAVTVLAVAVLGLILAAVAGRIYRDHALEVNRAALSRVVHGEVGRTERELMRHTELIAQFAAAPLPATGFPGAPYLPDGSGAALVFVTLYGADGRPVAARKFSPAAADEPFCSPPVPATLDPGGRYCEHDGRLYYAVHVPLAHAAAASLQAIYDVAAAFAAIEPALALPLRVVGPDGRPLYESPAWPVDGAAKDAFFASYVLAAPGDHAYVLQAVKNDEILYARIEQTRYAVFLTTAAVTLLFVLIAVAFLEYIVISPLRSLIEQLRAQQRDESQVGRRVEVERNSDFAELAARFNDMTGRLEHLYENVERMAFTDPLTQLPNRLLMQERLEQAIAAAQGDNRTFALFIMDLDRFKEINDTLGHNVGDALLQQVAVRLRAKLRESDTIARMGGDEFAVLLPTETAKQAETAARMLLQSLRSPFVIGAHQLDVRVSLGIALYPDHGVDAHTLIQRADIAMYAAKRTNAGHMFYDPRMDRHHPAQLTLMGELRQAVDHEQFVLYYQPKIGLRSNRVVGLEALVRWRHPSGKLIMPETFIPLLEQTGLIRSLTGWVTHEALRMARELRERGFELPIAVNVSARDLLDNSLAEDLAEQLGAHDASAHWLELEITESTVMSDIASAMGLLAQLSSMGFKLVIDDFGTGYSSLAYLKRLPVQAVKIDKSFVMGMVKDENDAAIVYTSIELCHNLGLQVVAEGVDDEAVLQRLRAHGCDAAQGIYLSRPLPAPELFEWLEKSNWGMRPRTAIFGS